MLHYLVRRLMVIPPILLVVHFASFAYSHFAIQAQQAANPWGSSVSGSPPVFRLYIEYFQNLFQYGFGNFPGSTRLILPTLADAAFASLGLLVIAYGLSIVLGLASGLAAVRILPARVSRWLTPVSTVGLALPSFFIGALFIAASVYYLLGKPLDTNPPLPLSGFGWDTHLIMPVLALMIRPTAQIAQTTASLLVEELDKQYITAARSIGNTWRSARWRHAFRNILAQVIIAIASSFRWMVAELILVEWIFNWPGLGRLLAQVLIPPQTTNPGSLGSVSNIFLYPPLLAILITLFSCAFLLSDAFSSVLAQSVDPRLKVQETEVTLG